MDRKEGGVPMGAIYKNGKKYGGYFTGPALDTTCDTNGTVFTSDNVQGVIEEVSDLVDGKESGQYSIKNICVGLNPVTNKTSLVISWNDGTNDQVGYIDFTN